jgi:hypothetical protein
MKFASAVLIMLTFSYGQGRLYSSFQIGGIDWSGFVLEGKSAKVDGVFLAGEVKYEFHPSFNAGIGVLVADEWCIPFGCGYKPNNFGASGYHVGENRAVRCPNA